MTSDDKWLITHDFAYQFGGAERCTAVMADVVLPDAELLFMGGDEPTITRMGLDPQRVRTILPGGARSGRLHRALSPVGAARILSLPPYEGHLLASTYAFAHWRRAEGKKIIYCHSPLRQIYSAIDDSPLRLVPAGLRSRALSSIWALDRRASTESDVIVATSSVVSDRIAEYWGRRPDIVIPPPVDLRALLPRSVAESRLPAVRRSHRRTVQAVGIAHRGGPIQRRTTARRG
ncbi:glycosyltransferase [Blastococcus sp. TML/M2B]|nr:glycosyltransferase [Blastococcus sp. TML/M2B]